jgi:Group 4 capsule polysaccharide lipoprotein gfcB, YjbF
MGQGLALKAVKMRAAVAVLAVAALAACGNDKSEPTPIGMAVGSLAKATVGRVAARRAAAAGGTTVAAAPTTRADIEKYGIPILRAVIPARSADALLTISDAKGGFVTWATTDGSSFTLRDGVLIQTRGLGPDLMSAQAPSAAALRTGGGTHQRIYFFLGEDDQPTRRTYDCTVTANGTEQIEIYARAHTVAKFTETCARPQGSITNTFWFDGAEIRKSKQLASGGLGYIDFERVVD